MEGMLDDRLDRRESRAAGDKNEGLVRVLAQEESPERPFEAQDGALLHRIEDELREGAPGRPAHMKLEKSIIVRGVGEREAAALALLEEDVDVFAGEELQALACRKLEIENRHVLRRLFDPLDAERHRANREIFCTAQLAHFENDVGKGIRAARERLARRLLCRVQRPLLVVAVRELA